MDADSTRWIRNFVDGRYVDQVGAGFPDVNPATGAVVAQVDEADRATVDAAVDAARRALPVWAATPVAERTALLRRAADRIEERFDEFVAAEIADTGKPIAQARSLDVPRAAANFRSFADVVGAAGQESFITETAGGQRALNYAVRDGAHRNSPVMLI